MATNGVSNGETDAAISKNAVENKAEEYATSHAKSNNWSSPGSAAFDFRSDVVTTPTASMLTAVAATTLLDDVFCEDPTTTSLESFIADLTGHAAGLLVLSGTMGNQICLRTHLGAPPHAIITDHRSHILNWEAGGVASLCGALVNGLLPKNGHHLTLADIKANAVLGDDVHSCPTRIISLENTLNGTILPLTDCQAISKWARAQDPPILMHLDGARIWEAVASGAGSLKEYSECFDSMSLCFSKGLGAPIGSIIVGSHAFIKRARWVRKSLGGGLRQSGVIAAPARVAVEETFLGGHLTQTHRNAKRVAGIWENLGGKLAHPTETNMVWVDLEASGVDGDKWIELGKRRGLKLGGGRLVVHYQIGEEAIGKLQELMEEVLKKKLDDVDVNEKDVEKMKLDVE